MLETLFWLFLGAFIGWNLPHRKDIIYRLNKAKTNSPLFQPQLFVKTLESVYRNLI